MDIIEEDERLGTVGGKTERIMISRRDSVLNDLKNSTIQGLLSFLLSLASLFLFLAGIYRSYLLSGAAGYSVGVMMAGSLVIAVLSFIFGILGYKNRKKIRHYMEKRGIILSIIIILLLIVLYLRGIQLYIS